MIQSMTGFGKAVVEVVNKKVSIELKSLNSKQLDLNVRMPSIYREKELEIRTLLSQVIERGKVECLVSVEHIDPAASSKISESAIRSYYGQIKEVAHNLGVDIPNDWFSIIFRLPDVVKTEVGEFDESEWETVYDAFEKALKALMKFRTQEGTALEEVFRNKIGAITELLQEIDKYDSDRIEKIKMRLIDASKKLDVSYDENRFEQEMIYYIERLDVNEEKVRLGNHLKYFMETMESEKKQGRKLGFIAQEIGREINTLGSKSNDAEMQKIVVRMKDELEQMKEQILNVL
ncbi:MAG: YicC family protein [Candidatus Azobacteroides sp.]|nr:YicC family protein [Candidatus Azobacteroides sp.]